MRTLTRVASAGSAATAIAFGPARVGFGLFLPQFREEFGISTSTAGLISSAGFAAFLMGLIGSYLMILRFGPRAPIVAGMVLALLGLTTAAMAPNALMLALGVFFASASAGLAWTPFNDAAKRALYDEERPEALSVISSGTAVGVMGAGVFALALVLGGFDWRLAWAAFALASGLAALANFIALSDTTGPDGGVTRAMAERLAERSAIPLFLVAASFGVTNGIYVTFAADRVSGLGGLPGLPAEASAAIVFSAYGAAGLIGLATARVKSGIGLAWLLRLLHVGAATSIALIAFVPQSWPGLIVSAGLQGIYVMMLSATLSMWSERLFPAIPSLSFTAALLVTALGNVGGPAIAGIAADSFGAVPMFAATAAVALATALVLKPGILRERPEPEPKPAAA
ncbi:Major Facilitator Superfamily protein [Roseivivax jejudonensis]|uniref:Major Facilitator Superfamily protein n=1 Tax=Roseivivax jejudonensis TaxID=1529041 RepID=A0A1X6Y3W1_9RHOB|nr:MFS transporter [Roseivivax jejudonensis]SLN09961.1 Major Facilitator Superfamily protein [Roseivivax jejudonensis]